MRYLNSIRSLSVCATLVAAPALFAQQWEVGVQGGGGFYLNNSIKGARGSGEAGFKPGLSVGAWIGHDSLEHFSGEVRYMFQWNQMKVKSGGTSYDFGGQAHSFQYDVLIHTRPRDSSLRPFFVVGGGMKQYRGTGREVAVQPLSNVAILSQTKQWLIPMVDLGVGVKWSIGDHTAFRVEVRDYITQFPGDVIMPSPGNYASGWVHSFMPLVGVSYRF